VSVSPPVDGNGTTEHRAVAPELVRLDELTKRFEGGALAVDRVSLAIGQGEILALLGPSGSGKTTTLRLLAGFELPTAGRIVVDGADLTGVPAVRRRFGMVFQHYALFPHLNVGENVAFGLESLGVAKPERRERVARALEMVDLAGFESRPVEALSGGQQQRVALARALAPEPRVLLLDEPLSNLDPSLRERTRRELRTLIHRIGITTVLVTHEQEEAFDLADRIALLRNGALEQVGTPEQLYREPASAFVATFIGRAASVLVEIRAREAEAVRIGLPGQPGEVALRGVRAPNGPAQMLVQPEGFSLVAPGAGAFTGRVVDVRFRGASSRYLVRLADGQTLEVEGSTGAASAGSSIGLIPAGAGIHLFPRDGQ
jgi:ABC-type Fe3+/spermidine/putrescine transport system ATPase subunit